LGPEVNIKFAGVQPLGTSTERPRIDDLTSRHIPLWPGLRPRCRPFWKVRPRREYDAIRITVKILADALCGGHHFRIVTTHVVRLKLFRLKAEGVRRA
jgi:hypothetical protein